VTDRAGDGGRKAIIEGFVLRGAGVTDRACDGGKVIIEGFVLRGAGDRWGLRWREGHH